MAKKQKEPKKMKPTTRLKFNVNCKYKEKYNRSIRKKIFKCINTCLQGKKDLENEQVLNEIKECIIKCLREILTQKEATEIADEPWPFIHIE